MKKKNYCFRRGFMALCVLMGLAQMSSAQVGVGITTPDPSAQLQIESTNKGILIPRVTATSVVTAPATGLMVYQTDAPAGFYYNSGTALSPEWVKLATGSSGLADSSVTNVKVSPSAAIAYSKLALTNSIGNGDLTANSVTTSKLVDGAVSSGKILDNSIVNADVNASAAIAYSKLSLTNSIVSDDISNSAVTPAKISASGASNGDVLTYNGSSVSWAAPSGGSSSDAFSAANTTSGVIAVVLGGTSLPLPNNQNLNTFTVDGTNTVFTVPSTGEYRIDYNISITAQLLVSTQVTRNGAPISESVISPTVAKDEFHTGFIVALTAGDTLSLQMFGLLGAATLSGGASNGMIVQKLF